MYGTDHAIGRKLKRINNALDSRRTREINELELTSSQAFILGYLNHHRDKDVFPGDIVTDFGLKHSTVSGILQRLEAKDFIHLTEAEDRRKKRISLTEKGIECHARITQMLAENERLITASMTPEQQAQLETLLDLVLKNVADAEECCCRGRGEEPHV